MKRHVGHSPQRQSGRLGITARLLFLTFAVILCGFVLSSAVHIYKDTSFRIDALHSRANLLADLQATAVAAPLSAFEREAMASVLTSLQNTPDFQGARISQPDGSVIMDVGVIDPDGDQVTARRKIVWQRDGQTHLIGYVDIAMSRAGINAELADSLVLSATVVGVLISVMLGTLFLAARHIIRPLDSLNAAMHQLAEGKLNVHIPYLGRGDEIGRIAQAISVLKDNANELHRLRGNLEQQVAEQTEDLRAAKDAAESANRAKSKFLSSMSHELRTPLNAIMGYAQLMDMNPNIHEDPRTGESVKQILSSSGQLLALIEQILDLSRMEAGELFVNAKDVTLDSVLTQVLPTVRDLAVRFHVMVERSGSPCWHTTVHVDPKLLRQALYHLLSNAIKYNRPSGRVDIRCEHRADGQMRVSVQDTGRGIPQQQRDELFKPFTRLDLETSIVEGTGVGLTITKKVLEAMGCAIGFESVENSGSTFWIDMPPGAEVAATSTPQVQAVQPDLPPARIEKEMQEAAAAHAPARETTQNHDDAPPMDGGGKVLYVEDSPANIALLQQYFKMMEGPELLIATTGEEGVDMARDLHPALILMDINLPGINGDEAMRQLRADGAFDAVPIVAVSADSTKDVVQKAMDAGFDDYITKPIKLALLEEALGKHMGWKRSEGVT